MPERKIQPTALDLERAWLIPANEPLLRKVKMNVKTHDEQKGEIKPDSNYWYAHRWFESMVDTQKTRLQALLPETADMIEMEFSPVAGTCLTLGNQINTQIVDDQQGRVATISPYDLLAVTPIPKNRWCMISPEPIKFYGNEMADKLVQLHEALKQRNANHDESESTQDLQRAHDDLAHHLLDLSIATRNHNGFNFAYKYLPKGNGYVSLHHTDERYRDIGDVDPDAPGFLEQAGLTMILDKDPKFNELAQLHAAIGVGIAGVEEANTYLWETLTKNFHTYDLPATIIRMKDPYTALYLMREVHSDTVRHDSSSAYYFYALGKLVAELPEEEKQKFYKAVSTHEGIVLPDTNVTPTNISWPALDALIKEKHMEYRDRKRVDVRFDRDKGYISKRIWDAEDEYIFQCQNLYFYSGLAASSDPQVREVGVTYLAKLSEDQTRTKRKVDSYGPIGKQLLPVLVQAKMYTEAKKVIDTMTSQDGYDETDFVHNAALLPSDVMSDSELDSLLGRILTTHKYVHTQRAVKELLEKGSVDRAQSLVISHSRNALATQKSPEELKDCADYNVRESAEKVAAARLDQGEEKKLSELKQAMSELPEDLQPDLELILTTTSPDHVCSAVAVLEKRLEQSTEASEQIDYVKGFDTDTVRYLRSMLIKYKGDERVKEDITRLIRTLPTRTNGQYEWVFDLLKEHKFIDLITEARFAFNDNYISTPWFRFLSHFDQEHPDVVELTTKLGTVSKECNEQDKKRVKELGISAPRLTLKLNAILYARNFAIGKKSKIDFPENMKPDDYQRSVVSGLAWIDDRMYFAGLMKPSEN